MYDPNVSSEVVVVEEILPGTGPNHMVEAQPERSMGLDLVKESQNYLPASTDQPTPYKGLHFSRS